MKKSFLDGRKQAEILTFVSSLAIIIGLFSFLLLDYSRNSDSSALNIEITPRLELKKKKGTVFIIPVEIRNTGGKTPTKAFFRVEMKENGGMRSSHFEVEYLTKRSLHTVYLASETDLEPSELKVVLENYQF